MEIEGSVRCADPLATGGSSEALRASSSLHPACSPRPATSTPSNSEARGNAARPRGDRLDVVGGRGEDLTFIIDLMTCEPVVFSRVRATSESKMSREEIAAPA